LVKVQGGNWITRNETGLEAVTGRGNIRKGSERVGLFKNGTGEGAKKSIWVSEGAKKWQKKIPKKRGLKKNVFQAAVNGEAWRP